MQRELLSLSDVLSLQQPPWLVDYLIPEQSIGMLWGPPNIGKSFVTLDLACSLACGGYWLGQEVPAARPVIYVAAEGVLGFKRRVRGWMRARRVEQEDLEPNISFLDGPVALQKGVGGLIRLAKPLSPSLIIIDTLAACSLGIEEDKTEGIGPVLESAYQLRTDLRTSVLLVHHTGWSGEHERGSSGFRGGMDVSIELRGEKGWDQEGTKALCLGRSLYCHKQRDSEHFSPIHFRMREVQWRSQPGQPVSRTLVPAL